jgi:FkbM family methyltransferase
MAARTSCSFVTEGRKALLSEKIALINTLDRNLGTSAALRYLWHRARWRVGLLAAAYVLRSKYAKYPLWCRPDSSDLSVFGQIFVQREYRCLDMLSSADLIIDCGANVGYSAAYFLTRFDHARVIAIEPDPANFALLQRNLAPYGARARCIQAGVWSHSTALVIDESSAGAGAEWARTVRPARAGDTDALPAVDIATLLNESGAARISILKVDIEGSEREVFARNTAGWLPRVDNLVIELHGAECTQVFDAAVEPERFLRSTCDELTVCVRT